MRVVAVVVLGASQAVRPVAVLPLPPLLPLRPGVVLLLFVVVELGQLRHLQRQTELVDVHATCGANFSCVGCAAADAGCQLGSIRAGTCTPRSTQSAILGRPMCEVGCIHKLSHKKQS